MSVSFSSFLCAREKDRSFGSFQKEYLSVMKEMKGVEGHLGVCWRAGGWPWNNNQAEKLSLSEKQYFLGNICLSH